VWHSWQVWSVTAGRPRLFASQQKSFLAQRAEKIKETQAAKAKRQETGEEKM